MPISINAKRSTADFMQNDIQQSKLRVFDQRIARAKRLRFILAFIVPLCAAAIFVMIIALSEKRDNIFLYVISIGIVAINSVLNYFMLSSACKSAVAEKEAFLQAPAPAAHSGGTGDSVDNISGNSIAGANGTTNIDNANITGNAGTGNKQKGNNAEGFSYSQDDYPPQG